MRRLAVLLTVAAVVVAGCGGGDTKPSTALDDALGYFAKDAPFVAAIQTDPDGKQLGQLKTLTERLPVAALIGPRLQRFTGFDFVRFSKDVEPQLGAPLVLGLERPAAPGGFQNVLVGALRVKHPTAAKQFLLRQPGFLGRGKSSGVRIFENTQASRYAALDGDVLLLATNRDILEFALAMHRTDNRMRQATFEHDLEGLPKDAFIQATGDPRAAIGVDPRLRPALDVKWLASMQRFGATLTSVSSGIAADLRIATDAKTLKDSDLPLSPKPGLIPLIGNRYEVQAGVRDPDRLARFAFAVAHALARTRLAIIEKLQPRGVDLERQLVHHLKDSAALAIDPFSKEFAARATIVEPGDVKTGIDTLAPVLPNLASIFGINGLGVATPEPGENFYALAKPNGKTVVFGVVGNTIVAASDARRAAGLASAPTRKVGPPAAAVITVDAQTLANRLIKAKISGPTALFAPLVTSKLRDFTAWILISRSALRGHAKLTILK